MHFWLFLWCVSAVGLLGSAFTLCWLLTFVSLAIAVIDTPDL